MNYGQCGVLGRTTNGSERVESVEERHVEIQNNQVVRGLQQPLQRCAPISRFVDVDIGTGIGVGGCFESPPG